MGPMQALPAAPVLIEEMPPSRLYFSLRGRIDRRRFWLHGVLALLLAGIVATALLEIAGLRAERAERLVNVLMAWPLIAVSAKRWHDRDRPAWWVLIALVPIVGQIWMLIDNGFVPGTKGPNRFGNPPQD